MEWDSARACTCPVGPEVGVAFCANPAPSGCTNRCWLPGEERRSTQVKVLVGVGVVCKEVPYVRQKCQVQSNAWDRVWETKLPQCLLERTFPWVEPGRGLPPPQAPISAGRIPCPSLSFPLLQAFSVHYHPHHQSPPSASASPHMAPSALAPAGPCRDPSKEANTSSSQAQACKSPPPSLELAAGKRSFLLRGPQFFSGS